MRWPEIKFVFSLCLSGGFFGCCYLARLNPLFFHLAVLMAGVVLGVVTNATMRDMEEKPPLWSTGRDNERRLIGFLPNKGKIDMACKLWGLMRASQVQGDYSLTAAEDEARIGGAEPDVFRVDNDNLWLVVNQGEHFAFRDPEFPGVTVVMKGAFAMRALALGFLPALPRFPSGDEDIPKKKKVEACYRRGKC